MLVMLMASSELAGIRLVMLFCAMSALGMRHNVSCCYDEHIGCERISSSMFLQKIKLRLWAVVARVNLPGC